MSAIASADDISMNPVPAATLFEAALGRLSDVLTPGSFLEATPESLVVAETGGEIIYANAACERLTDRGPQTIGVVGVIAPRCFGPRRRDTNGRSGG